MIQAIPASIDLDELVKVGASYADRVVHGIWATIRPWQWAVIWELIRDRQAFDQMRSSYTPHTFNTNYGVRASFGRRAGHSSLARVLLASLHKAMLVVPSSEPPFSRKPQHVRALEDAGRPDLADKIWVSRPVDIVAAIEGEPTRDDLLEKRLSPFSDADYCIVDDAAYMSQDELRLLRSIPWNRYIELA
jgi:hypothetical protein